MKYLLTKYLNVCLTLAHRAITIKGKEYNFVN